MLNVKEFSDSILPRKDLHLARSVELHAKFLRWHFPDPANEKTSEEFMLTNQGLNLSGLDQHRAHLPTSTQI